MSGPLAPAIRGLASGIGLVSEYRHHRKEQAAAKNAVPVSEYIVPSGRHEHPFEPVISEDISNPRNQTSHAGEGIEAVTADEDQWYLDEAQDQLTNNAEKPKKKIEHTPTKMIKNFTTAHPLIEGVEYETLLLPVILPQRRPKNRTRGFIRAYASELQKCGIDQETFMELIEVFNTATLAAPWLDAINLCSLAFCTLPTLISQAAAIAIAIAVDITKNLQSRHRQSYVLDQLNNEFFRPRGLYALVLTWNPHSKNSKVSVNINDAVASNVHRPEGMLNKAKHDFKPSMGDTVGVAFEESAPLIFPHLDSLVNADTPDGKEFKAKVKNAKGLIAEYFDRRAQAEHAGENPDSQLAVTKPVFSSRYSDPNNPTNSGDLLALVSGGKLSMPQRGGLLSRGRSSGGFGASGLGGMIGGGLGGCGDRFQGRGFSRFQQNQPLYDNGQYQGYDQSLQSYQQRTTGRFGSGLGVGPGRGLLGGLGGFGAGDGVLGIKRVFQHVSPTLITE